MWTPRKTPPTLPATRPSAFAVPRTGRTRGEPGRGGAERQTVRTPPLIPPTASTPPGTALAGASRRSRAAPMSCPPALPKIEPRTTSGDGPTGTAELRRRGDAGPPRRTQRPPRSPVTAPRRNTGPQPPAETTPPRYRPRPPPDDVRPDPAANGPGNNGNKPSHRSDTNPTSNLTPTASPARPTCPHARSRVSPGEYARW